MKVSKNGSILNISLSMDEDSFIPELETALDTAFSWQEKNWLSHPNFFQNIENTIGCGDLDDDDSPEGNG